MYRIATIGALGEPGNPYNPYPSLEDLWRQAQGQVPGLPNVPNAPIPIPSSQVAKCNCPTEIAPIVGAFAAGALVAFFFLR